MINKMARTKNAIGVDDNTYPKKGEPRVPQTISHRKRKLEELTAKKTSTSCAIVVHGSVVEEEQPIEEENPENESESESSKKESEDGVGGGEEEEMEGDSGVGGEEEVEGLVAGGQEEEMEGEGDEEMEGDCEGRANDEDSDNDAQLYPFPGGPETPELLTIYKFHVALLAWEGKGSDILRVHNHIVNLSGWDITKEPPYVQQKIEDAGFNGIVKYSFKIINRPLIFVMVERWYPETNNFHLSVGEMTLTLDDVKQITGLPVIGKAVNPSGYSCGETPNSLMMSVLGLKDSKKLKDELAKGGVQKQLL